MGLADDSGLEVDYLNGAPGVLSARFAGEHGDDAKNNEKLLALLAGVPDAKNRPFPFGFGFRLAGRRRLDHRGHLRRIIALPPGEQRVLGMIPFSTCRNMV